MRLSQAFVALLALAASSPCQERIALRHGPLDPAHPPTIPAGLAARAEGRLWLVQGVRLDADLRARIEAAGGEIVSCLPPTAYLVRGAAPQPGRGVRAVMPWHPFFRLDPELIGARGAEAPAAREHHLLLTSRRDVAAVEQAIEALGGTRTAEASGRLVRAELTAEQVVALAGRDDVLWIEPRRGGDGVDLDHARIQGGAHHVETVAGYAGQGLVAHTYEDLDPTHPDLLGATITQVGAPALGATAHGMAVAGVQFARGRSHPRVRGIAPETSGICYTDFRGGTPRDLVLSALVNTFGCSTTSASWGGLRTPFYTAVSAALDDAVFDHDITYTQSMSDSGTQQARPEAWSKNVISVGGVVHGDNADASDDSTALAGASVGPAADGRIVPTLVGYHDSVWTSDLVGAAGYGPLDHFDGFGGTSAAAPMVSGHAILAIQMFTDALFGNALRSPGASRHVNRPHFPTVRALLVASAAQYPFGPGSPDHQRPMQGWGFPNLRALYEARADVLVVDEEQVLVQGGAWTQALTVRAGAAELKVCLSWAEPGANPAAIQTLVNDLDLELVDPTGTVYRGNGGLESGPFSVANTPADRVNPIECVFLSAPTPGTWTLRVVATTVALDNHVETPAVDVDFGLVALVGDTAPPPREAIVTAGRGCGAATLDALGPATLGGTLSLGLAGLPSMQPAIALLGDDDRTWTLTGLPLPAALGLFGRPACVLFVDPTASFLLTADAQGNAQLALPIPNLPSLANTAHHLQALYLDPAIGGPAPFAATAGLRIHL